MGFSISDAPARRKPAKKPAAKKPAAKPAAKKPAAKPAAKKPAAKPAAKPSAAKPAAKKPAAKQEKKETARVPPKIARKPPTIVKPAPRTVEEVDTAKAVAFAMSIAQEMKQSARNADAKREANEIRLARRPTTRTQGKNTAKFPAADLKDFRRRLIEARESALSGVDAMKATGFNESDDHEADGGDGTNQTLRLQALGQMGQINRTIQQIEEALHRIDDGTYGVCTVCGQLIRKPRLLNQPFVLTCMECQSEMERSRRG
ncbi:MAG: TraR/DksA C4-type zinc finger protein [Kiritimatiellae bacterium]|nr:TraR/DksA C4-type zinc finger protein [Kiritimatiellia bacterium]